MSDPTVLTPPPEFKIPRPAKASDAAVLNGPENQERPRPALDLPRPSRDRLHYMPALDGVRALAVIAVVAYHADQTWARAGFLGVDIFFVISGYLITALLLNEFRREGRISIVQFWKRRALRLLPSLLLMLAIVSLVAPILAPDQIAQLRGDMVAALVYVSNWRLIFQDLPYFQAMGRPPLLRHLWSLAVEEQFYLLWPAILALVLRRGWTRSGLLFSVLLGTAASAIAMAIIYSPDTDASRVYYGTDTRVGTILMGAALAFVWSPGQRTARPRLLGSLIRDFAGLGALGALAWLIYSWNEFNELLYRGGFIAIAALSVVLVGVSAHPGRLTRHLLGNPPLRWIGKRSYAIYLWHWPVIMLTRPQLDIDLDGNPLLALRVGITLALAVITHRLVEKPVRQGALSNAWDRMKSGSLRPAVTGFAVLLLPAAIAAGVGIGIARSDPTVSASSSIVSLGAANVMDEDPGAFLKQYGAVDANEVVEAPAPAPEPAPAPPPVTPSITALGDSVMLIARDALIAKFGSATIPASVDAAIGRQAKAMIETAQGLKDAGQLGATVVVHTGTNGPLTRRQLESLMEVLRDVPRVFLVNVKVARPWESVNNNTLAENIQRWPNAKLIDWNGVANSNPEVFYKDGVHLKPRGVNLYVDLLSGSVLQ